MERSTGWSGPNAGFKDGGLSLAIGMSTVVSGLDQIADAHREADLARASLDPAPGVVALTEMSAFDYLTGCDLHRFADLVEILIAARFVSTPR